LLIIAFLFDYVKSFYTYDYWTWGIPFVFSWVGGWDLGSGFYLEFLIIDIIFWYLLSCLIIWIYDKRKKKSK